MIKVKNVKTIDVNDWDELVSKTYNKIYSFQQQDGCRERATFYISIPDKDNDHNMNDTIPEVINGSIMGVKFKKWLERDVKQPLSNSDYLSLFWTRNFYPDIQTVANDLYEKGLIEAGDYIINIDW